MEQQRVEQPAAPARRGPTSGVHVAVAERSKPLLASEALCDEVAPCEPCRREARLWLLGVALSLGLVGLGFRLGLGVPETRFDAATLSFSGAGAVAAVALLPFPYLLRAAVSLLIGGALTALGFVAAGPLGGIALDGGLARDLTRLVPLVALPAALLFRAHYRAYRLARWLLAAALLASLPYAVLEGMLVADGGAPVITRIAAGTSVTLVLCSCFGFVGDTSTGASGLWAALVLAGLPAEIASRELTPLAGPDTGDLTYAVTAVALIGVGVLTSLGLFQLLAGSLGQDARRAAEGATRRALT